MFKGFENRGDESVGVVRYGTVKVILGDKAKPRKGEVGGGGCPGVFLGPKQVGMDSEGDGL